MWYTFIGITIASSFVAFFSLGVLLTMCVGHVLKTKSKLTPHKPTLEPSVYEMVDTGQKNITSIFEVEANSAYGIVK